MYNAEAHADMYINEYDANNRKVCLHTINRI